MLLIRDPQLTTLGESARRSFVFRAMDHLTKHFRACAAMDESELRGFVESGITRAAGHGIVIERDVVKYLSLMVVFGQQFDTRLDWAKETLAANAGPRLRANRLYERGLRRAKAGETA